jgi:hypothetical protein
MYKNEEVSERPELENSLGQKETFSRLRSVVATRISPDKTAFLE